MLSYDSCCTTVYRRKISDHPICVLQWQVTNSNDILEDSSKIRRDCLIEEESPVLSSYTHSGLPQVQMKANEAVLTPMKNFSRATYMTNKWPQSNKLVKLRDQSSCAKLRHGFFFLGAAYKKLEFDLCERVLSTNRFQKQKFHLTILLSSLVSSFFVESSSNFANFSFGLWF